ncbi:hypothetical protein BC833DRAFT_572446 [Globomyces pollinis-pini]|nr:hypothetical protein BC833DRAFT_572446 [Globomyces pollinis-pini]
MLQDPAVNYSKMEKSMNMLNLMPRLESHPTLNSSYVPNSNSSAVVSSRGDYASVGTIGSWDETEQDYDIKATREVTEMVDQLGNLLYQDEGSSIDNLDLLDECKQWTTLFPHLRIRGVQLIPSKETGFQFISNNTDVRALSPYFRIPAVELENPDVLQIQGIKIPNEAFNCDESLQKSSDLKDVETNGNCFPTRKCVEWSDQSTNFFRKIERSPDKRLWGIFQVQKYEDVEDRAPTPTPNIYGEDRSTTPTPSNPYIDQSNLEKYHFHIEFLKEGVGDVKSLQEATRIISSSVSSNEIFAISLNHQSQVDNQPAIMLHTWNSPSLVHENTLINTIDLNLNIENERGENIISLADITDIFRNFQLNEVQSRSLESFISEDFQCTGAQTFTTDVLHGIVDEYFAFDAILPELTRPLSSESAAPDTSLDSLNAKKDLIHTIFDDLWSEVYPKFHPIVTKLADDILQNKSQDMSSGSASPSCFEMVPDDEDNMGSDLLSAITIRHIPLQKRESSAKFKTDTLGGLNMFQSENLIGATSRPTSGRVLPQRPASARSTLSRPTSARPQEPNPLRNQQNISKTTNANSWKRNASGFRLVPIVANQTNNNTNQNQTINEMMYVTSLPQKSAGQTWDSRGGTNSQNQHLGKKLPPIRGIMTTLDPSVDGPPKAQRHVAFEPTFESVEIHRANPSPRPLSARRQISSALRSRNIPLSRPHTAISESRSRMNYKRSSLLSVSDERIISPVMGVRMSAMKQRRGRS